MCKRIFFSMMMLLIVYSGVTYARYTVVTPPEHLVSGYENFINKQIRFLNNLKRCRPYTMKARNPIKPNVIVIKSILGRQRNFCRVRKSLVYSDKDRPIYSRLCYFTHEQTNQMTTRRAYQFTRNLGKIAHDVHDLKLSPPEIKRIERTACQTEDPQTAKEKIGLNRYRYK